MRAVASPMPPPHQGRALEERKEGIILERGRNILADSPPPHSLEGGEMIKVLSESDGEMVLMDHLPPSPGVTGDPHLYATPPGSGTFIGGVSPPGVQKKGPWDSALDSSSRMKGGIPKHFPLWWGRNRGERGWFPNNFWWEGAVPLPTGGGWAGTVFLEKTF